MCIRDSHQGLIWIKYYLFLKKDHPLGAKLGVPQKISYLFSPVLVIVMFYTCLLYTSSLRLFQASVLQRRQALSRSRVTVRQCIWRPM